MKNIDQIWKNACTNLKKTMIESSYTTWIIPLQLQKIEDNTIYLGAASQFNVGFLEDNYYTQIKNAVTTTSGQEYHIEFVAIDEKNYSPKNNTQNFNYPFEESAKLNPKYTFDDFVIGNSNQLAHAACLAVAETLTKRYNPLFIHGGVGLGKTHLMHAIGNKIKEKNKNMKISYVTSEKFTNELINSIKDDSNEAFRNRYRNVDVLLVDDIQFIAGKDSTQEEFFHTFNALYNDSKHIVLSSDRPPKEIKKLEDRIRSRFEGGLIVDVQAPDYETRIAILRKKAEKEAINISNDVNEYIAKNIRSNIRELEGALTKVIAYATLTKKEIDKSLAEDALKDIFKPSENKQVSSHQIKKMVANFYNLKIEDLNSKRRPAKLVLPRQIAMYLCRELTDMSLPEIGTDFGGRDHTTVLHNVDKITKLIVVDDNLKDKIDAFKEKLQ